MNPHSFLFFIFSGKFAETVQLGKRSTNTFGRYNFYSTYRLRTLSHIIEMCLVTYHSSESCISCSTQFSMSLEFVLKCKEQTIHPSHRTPIFLFFIINTIVNYRRLWCTKRSNIGHRSVHNFRRADRLPAGSN